jgi:hypothetical protein
MQRKWNVTRETPITIQTIGQHPRGQRSTPTRRQANKLTRVTSTHSTRETRGDTIMNEIKPCTPHKYTPSRVTFTRSCRHKIMMSAS